MTPILFTTASAGFESARHVELLPAGHRCRSVHGHSFRATVFAAAPATWAPFPGAEVNTLRQRLEACVAPLDYSDLNRHLDIPTDENLARWVRDRLGLPGIDRVAIQSTEHQGVDLDRHGVAHLWRRYRFQAAHRLPNVAPGHKCGRMHGHGFEVIIHANMDLGEQPMGIDYDLLDTLWAPLNERLNYQCLNELPGLENPTSEHLAAWLWRALKPQLQALSWVTVFETGSCGANFDGQHYRIWKDFTLDSAVRLRRAPPDAPQSRIHGHTYTLRLHLSAPLDQVHGWTIDYGDVKTLFDPIFRSLDHHPLYDHPELADTDSASVATWIHATAQRTLPALVRVDLYERPGCGTLVTDDADSPALPV